MDPGRDNLIPFKTNGREMWWSCIALHKIICVSYQSYVESTVDCIVISQFYIVYFLRYRYMFHQNCRWNLWKMQSIRKRKMSKCFGLLFSLQSWSDYSTIQVTSVSIVSYLELAPKIENLPWPANRTDLHRNCIKS